MILFCDTSALVKLYLEEDYSADVRELAADSQVIAVVRIARAEIMAALARRAREQPADADAIEVLRVRLTRDWQEFAIMEVTQALVELAGEYADTFALRGYDSVQLAAARQLQNSVDEVLCFAYFDSRLNKAAMVLGMMTLRKVS